MLNEAEKREGEQAKIFTMLTEEGIRRVGPTYLLATLRSVIKRSMNAQKNKNAFVKSLLRYFNIKEAWEQLMAFQGKIPSFFKESLKVVFPQDIHENYIYFDEFFERNMVYWRKNQK